MADITVTVSDDHLQRIDDVAARLRGAGMQVDRVLHPVGIITGSIGRAGRAAIAGVPGVASVEESGRVRLPPPDAEVQ